MNLLKLMSWHFSWITFEEMQMIQIPDAISNCCKQSHLDICSVHLSNYAFQLQKSWNSKVSGTGLCETAYWMISALCTTRAHAIMTSTPDDQSITRSLQKFMEHSMARISDFTHGRTERSCTLPADRDDRAQRFQCSADCMQPTEA